MKMRTSCGGRIGEWLSYYSKNKLLIFGIVGMVYVC